MALQNGCTKDMVNPLLTVAFQLFLICAALGVVAVLVQEYRQSVNLAVGRRATHSALAELAPAIPVRATKVGTTRRSAMPAARLAGPAPRRPVAASVRHSARRSALPG